ncbi:very-short-patch-repair endonuclease [Microbacterium resistens]|uniref:Very-short-patch-repair endonuclease n=1 Tax=Microbacterium resistens TaxID=156977 RepID=A0ABU1SEM0_9MICO|nr:DUF559 domain-containing protein [Microbacterium resistens]MDR6868060.1 very-short-patch-repair endonuclease [Microbacterium resistens]
MDLIDWVRRHGGIAHRADAAAHGFSPSRVRAEIRRGALLRVNASWIGLDDAPPDLLTAARAGGRLTCVSLARRRGWWVPEGAEDRVHVHVHPNARRPLGDVRTHWAAPIVPLGPRRLEASVEDALAHASRCFFEEDALSIWESAIRIERIDIESLRQVHWPDPRTRRYARLVRGSSDSGLETLVVVRLSHWGVPIRQQVRIAGHDVDILIGTHLVLQIDGFAHHSGRADRLRDVRHDAELQQRGYTVLRFTYEQVMRQWEEVERTVARAIARGLHLSPAMRSGR